MGPSKALGGLKRLINGISTLDTTVLGDSNRKQLSLPMALFSPYLRRSLGLQETGMCCKAAVFSSDLRISSKDTKNSFYMVIQSTITFLVFKLYIDTRIVYFS